MTRCASATGTIRVHRAVSEASRADRGARLSWWSQAGSNRPTLACHASALPAELWPHAKAPETTQGRRRCQAIGAGTKPARAVCRPLEFAELRAWAEQFP